MLTPLEQTLKASHSPSKRYTSQLRTFFANWSWCLHTRRHLMCRLPFLFIWTFVALIFIYKSLNSKTSPENVKPDDLVMRMAVTSSGRFAAVRSGRMSTTLRREIRVSSHSDKLMPADDHGQQSERATTPIVISNDTSIGSIFHRTSTTKKIITEYSRESKVCILLIQSASMPVFSINSNKRRRSHAAVEDIHANSRGHGKLRDDINEQSHKIPNHIRLVIEILDAQKIDYVIETTHLGIPTSLLTPESSQYSVIVIDDFLKYTKLDRWMRDQLDRYCRKSQIGIVTYLNPDEIESESASVRNKIVTHRTIKPPLSGGSTTRESMTDQFPLTMKPIDRRTCKKQSICAYDYQLNDQTSLLRILKRKRDFIVSASLRDSADLSVPWISMSSDHVTYEPLTWARIKHASSSGGGNRFMSRARRGTRDSTLTMSSLSSSLSPGNNVRPSVIDANAKSKRVVDYDAYEPPMEIDESGDGLHAASGYTQQGHNKNQLQPVAVERNLRESTVLNVDSYNNEKTANHVNSTMMHDGSERHSYSGGKDDGNNNTTTTTTSNDGVQDYGTIEPELEVLSMFDRGLYDGIKRVIFGRANHHWLDRIILLDAIEHMSSGKILTSLERYIQIDIDDIFVGERGKRMNKSDVDALIDSQEHFSRLIDGGFKFNLGFSGKYYKHGDEIENGGDEYLVSRANHFNWFCHTWSHSKAHLVNDTKAIEIELRKNLQFAKQHQLPLIGHGGPIQDDTITMPETYAIAPHHSGVYPVHEQLYNAWRKVLNVRVTSTEEYPGLRPASNRQAFVHKAIKVLPRQTCGLYTHTIYRDRYPGGADKLEASIRGGELFETILHNPVNIYMTHMSNYAHDRLALGTFLALIEFVQTYTNLQLKFAPSTHGQLGPAKLADYYFGLFPSEREPVWTNPCKDKRHLAIWAPEKQQKYCSVVPQLLIVGPQKTGTTALYSFLNLHPEFKSSHQSPVDFEEVQFFNDKHYFQGVDWYFSRFSPDTKLDGAVNLTENEGEYFYYDKSATYFDDPKAARRAKSLLPEARIVILLVDPADRAYSWYQHIKAHGDEVANSMSFEQIIMFEDDNNSTTFLAEGSQVDVSKVRALKNRCLQPGYYSAHLSRWLEHFPSRQIILIDGQWFKQSPASVMNKLQLILRTQQRVDYGNLLVFDERKGFYCHRQTTTTTTTDGRDDDAGHKDNRENRKETIKCLGPSKGRKYPAMAHETRLYLSRHYLAHNKQLARLLSDIGQPLPVWLEEAISAGRQRRLLPMVFS